MIQPANEPLFAETRDEQLWMRDSPLRARARTSDVVVGAAALGIAAAAATVVGTGGLLTEPTALAAVLVANVMTAAVAGLMWRHARPSSSFGTLLLLEGLLIALNSLAGSAVPGVYFVGVLAGWAAGIGVTWLLVAFPRARPRGAAWIVLSLALGAFVFGELPLILASPTLRTLSVLGRCTEVCPANPGRLIDAPTVAATFRHVEGALEALWGSGILAFTALRFVRASHPQRRMLAPLYVLMAPFIAAFTVSAVLSNLAGIQLSFGGRVVFAATQIAGGLGFIGALVLARSYAGAALGFMTARLVGHPSVAAIEQLVRRVLDDPQARLAFWLPRGRMFVDRHGKPIAFEPLQEGISWRSFRQGDEPVLAIAHDSGLSEDTELLDAVGAATLLALENRRLQEDLVDSVRELRASQQRLVSASSAERRKIERDLHDGVQQKLVALRIHLELARDLAEGENDLAGRLAVLGSEFDEALEELRSVAHGIYPPLLADEGLAAALREAGRRSTVSLTLAVEDVGRLSEECETAIYYCCLEALQNVAKHAGDDVVAALRLWRDRETVHFSVVDNGVGFVPHSSKSEFGLTNMADRIGAVGGSLAIRSAPGEGTKIEGRVNAYVRDEAGKTALRV